MTFNDLKAEQAHRLISELVNQQSELGNHLPTEPMLSLLEARRSLESARAAAFKAIQEENE